MAERGPQRVSASACSARMTKLEARVAHLDSVTEELRKLLCGQIERVEALEAECTALQNARYKQNQAIEALEARADGHEAFDCPVCDADECILRAADRREAVGTVGVALPAKGAMRDE